MSLAAALARRFMGEPVMRVILARRGRNQIQSTKSEIRNPKQIGSSKSECTRRSVGCSAFPFSVLGHWDLFRISDFGFRVSCIVLALLACAAPPAASAAKVTLDLKNAQNVTFVGAFHRWDQDGNLRKKVNPKAKIDAPEVDYTATKVGRLSKSSHEEGPTQWVFKDLPAGKYDLVILAHERIRIEGFEFAPVLEFDPFYPGTATVDEEARESIADHIKKSPQYENKVEPLYLGQGKGENQPVRILMMLIRDKVTSYESDFPGAATMRFEIWQYTWQYGGWAKDRRTRVMHRVILHRDELRKWTWLWDPKLGAVEVKKAPLAIEYEMPGTSAEKKLKGLYPY